MGVSNQPWPNVGIHLVDDQRSTAPWIGRITPYNERQGEPKGIIVIRGVKLLHLVIYIFIELALSRGFLCGVETLKYIVLFCESENEALVNLVSFSIQGCQDHGIQTPFRLGKPKKMTRHSENILHIFYKPLTPASPARV
ncbi:hypothetical protein VTO42DRAFT_5686 [Malbranchea cinnamomea]